MLAVLERHGLEPAFAHRGIPWQIDGGRRRSAARVSSYGCVVDSVNVSVLLYVPVRSGSLAPIDCWKSIVTASLDDRAGVGQQRSSACRRAARTRSPVPPALDALTCSGAVSANAPLTSRPRAFELGSNTDSAPSPADEITVGDRARVVGRRPRPAMNEPKLGARAERQRQRRRHGAADRRRAPACSGRTSSASSPACRRRRSTAGRTCPAWPGSSDSKPAALLRDPLRQRDELGGVDVAVAVLGQQRALEGEERRRHRRSGGRPRASCAGRV